MQSSSYWWTALCLCPFSKISHSSPISTFLSNALTSYMYFYVCFSSSGIHVLLIKWMVPSYIDNMFFYYYLIAFFLTPSDLHFMCCCLDKSFFFFNGSVIFKAHSHQCAAEMCAQPQRMAMDVTLMLPPPQSDIFAYTTPSST